MEGISNGDGLREGSPRQALPDQTGSEIREDILPVFHLARSEAGVTNKTLAEWIPTEAELVETLSKASVGGKDGSYFVRGPMPEHQRNDAGMPFAELLIIDGDKQISDEGELINGCVHPRLAHEALTALGIRHFICTSHSHRNLEKATEAGVEVDTFYKWRALIPCRMESPSELVAMSNWIVDQLQGLGCRVALVKEMSTWSQPWYFPRRLNAEAEFLTFNGFVEGLEPISKVQVEALTAEFKATKPEALPTGRRASEKDANSPIGRFNAKHDTHEDFAMLLARHGFEFSRSEWLNGDMAHRYIPPGSTTGAAGVRVYRGEVDGALLCYSHNGSFDLKGKALDYFGLFQLLEHGGDQQAALDALSKQPDLSDAEFSLDAFAISDEEFEQMSAAALTDTFVVGRLAIQGQMTAFFAEPGAGKTLITLKLLTEAAEAGVIKGEDVFYLNLDDNHTGFLTKGQLIKEFGIRTVGEGHKGFKSRQFTTYLEKMAEQDACAGKVVVLDTLKKFSDLMNKTASSEFNTALRAFVGKGGTVICLAHVNKRKDAEGKSIAAGTSDVKDDFDCVYIIEGDAPDADGYKVVTFRNEKSRGNVAMIASYRYQRVEGQSYRDLFDSVVIASEAEAVAAKRKSRVNQSLEENGHVIDAVLQLIDVEPLSTRDIVKALCAEEYCSRSKAEALLRTHAGWDYAAGHRWKECPGKTRGVSYTPLMRLKDVMSKANAAAKEAGCKAGDEVFDEVVQKLKEVTVVNGIIQH